jgi:NAD(P)-dependent dehydrogenase (short-subunit alcohol dehydrogenase family)
VASWQDFHVPDQSGRLAVVTGANSGIGFEASRRLALAGADVLLAVRDLTKGQEAVARIKSEQPSGHVSAEHLDLASLESVAAISQLLLGRGRPLALLVNNAGIMAVPKRHTTVDGFELQFGTNYLGHFALTCHLLPLLLQSDAPRVVSLSSAIHHQGRINLDDLQSERAYGAWTAYSQSKLATLLFSQELHRLSHRSGWQLVSNAAHPGLTHSNLQATGPRHGQGSLGANILALLVRVAMQLPGLSQDATMGALPTLFAATSPLALSGGYYGPGGLTRLTGPPAPAEMAASARDPQIAARLWNMSERLTGLSFPPMPASPTTRP